MVQPANPGVDSSPVRAHQVGTFQWMPPELLLGEHYDERADVYR